MLICCSHFRTSSAALTCTPLPSRILGINDLPRKSLQTLDFISFTCYLNIPNGLALFASLLRRTTRSAVLLKQLSISLRASAALLMERLRSFGDYKRSAWQDTLLLPPLKLWIARLVCYGKGNRSQRLVISNHLGRAEFYIC